MEIKKKISKNIRYSFLILGISTYLILSFMVYNNYETKKQTKKSMFVEKEKLSFTKKMQSLDNFYKVLEIRLKSLDLTLLGKTSSRNIIELQNIIKQNNLLGKIEGISSVIIDLNGKRMITGEKIIDEVLLSDSLSKKFINRELEYDKFYSSKKELFIFKESYFSKNYPIMLSIEKKSFVGQHDGMKSYLLEDIDGQKELKELKIIDEFEIEGRKFVVASEKNSNYNFSLLLWLILPIFPIVVICYFLYKITVNFFYKYLVNLWKKIAGEEIESDNVSIDNIYETILDRNKFLLKKFKENEENYHDYILRSHILGINSNHNIKEIIETDSIYCGMINIVWKEDSIEDIFYKLNKLIEILKIVNINTISLSSEKVFLYSEEKIIQEILEEKLINFQNEYEISIFTFLDMDKLKIENLHEGSKRYEKYTEYGEKFQGRIVISNIDLESRKIKYTYFYPLNLEQKIITKISSRSLECLRKILDELFEENINNRILNLENKNRFKRVLVNSFERIIMHLGRNEIFDEFKEYFEKKELIEQDEFIKLTYEVSQKMMEYGKINSSREDNIEEKIKKFIEENYHREVSLIDFSDYMKLTPQYSSTIFKKITGENFNNTINSYRIKKAVEIFKEYEGGIKIKVLGEMVGFANPITFINNFKKIYGVSPTKYFQILNREEN